MAIKTKKNLCLPQEAHEAITVAWTVSLCMDAMGEAAGWGGGELILFQDFFSHQRRMKME